MNREDIIRMAREIAAQYSKAERFQTWTHDYMMQRLMELVEAEREACANVAKQISDKYGFGHYGNEVDTADEIEAAIRARGQA